jgi:hypothetical protein
MIDEWRLPLELSLMTVLTRKLETLTESEYTPDLFKTVIKTTLAVSNLQSELNTLLNNHAWNAQIFYYKRIKACFDNDVPLSYDALQIPIEGLNEATLFFVDDAIDQILSDLLSQSKNTGHKSNADECVDKGLSCLVDSLKCQNWKDAFIIVYEELVRKSIQFAFIEKMVSVVFAYMASMRNKNLDPSSIQLEYNQEDKRIKQTIMECSATDESKCKSQYLTGELHRITVSLISNSIILGIEMQQTRTLVSHAIKYGYPLPLSSAKLLVEILDGFLKRSNIYSGGIDLSISAGDENNLTVVTCKIGDGKAKVNMRHFGGSVFICQLDYRASIGMSNRMHSEVDNAFVYEALVYYLKHIRTKFPKQAESLREGLLNEIGRMNL